MYQNRLFSKYIRGTEIIAKMWPILALIFLLLLFILRINSIAFGAHADCSCTGIVRYAVRPASFSVEELVAKLPDSCAGRLTLSPDSRYSSAQS
jgi:hypothetical protein